MVKKSLIPKKERVHGYKLKENYGITREYYLEMLNSNKGLCYICFGTCSTGRRMAVDHDHTTGVVRGAFV